MSATMKPCGCCGIPSEKTPCGCCEGVVPITPVSPWNPPGLSAIKYRVGTYGQFRETMVSQLSSSTNQILQGLTTRADDDLTIGLLDSFAAVGDVLSFYQERIANEGYLRTATERLSILQLAREIGYELGPGVAASAALVFTMDTSGSVASTVIGLGTKVQSVPLQGKTPPEMPQTFETVQSIVAYPDFNSLMPLTNTVQSIDTSNIAALQQILLSGTNTRLQTGDRLLVAFAHGGTVKPAAVKTVSRVMVDQAAKQTTVNFVTSTGSLDYSSVEQLPAASSGTTSSGAAAGTIPLTQVDANFVRQLMGSQADYTELKALLARNNWNPSDFAKVVNSLSATLRNPAVAKIYALRSKAGIFGNNAQPWGTLPPGLTGPGSSTPKNGPPYPNSWEGAVVNTDSQGNPTDLGAEVAFLDNRYPSITKGSWVVLTSKERTGAYLVVRAEDQSMADFDLTAKSTALSLDVKSQRIESIGLSSISSEYFLSMAGKGFAPSSPVTFVIAVSDGSGSLVYVTSGTITTDSHGATGTFSTMIPSLGSGTLAAAISAKDSQGNPVASITVDLDVLLNYAQGLSSTWIDISPMNGPFGTVAGVDGYGFAAGAPITVYYNGQVVSLGQEVFVASDGSTSFDFVVPVTDTAGDHEVKVTDGTNSGVQFFTVTPELSIYKVRDTTVFGDSEELQLADEPIVSPITGPMITLDHFVAALQEGQTVAVTGQLADQPGVQGTEVVTIATVLPFAQLDSWDNPIPPQIPLTAIALEPPGLVNSYDPRTLAINANVAPATHGETKNEAVGSGDPTKAYLRFSLKQKPLTYVRPIPPASSPTGGVTTLQLRVDDIKWTEAPSLYGLAPDARSYIVRRDDDGTINVLFGNARPAVGIENITAQYRIGTGISGMVAGGQLSLLVSRPLGVKAVTNPLAADGAEDPEDRDHARENAPITVLTLDRIVSLTDVQNFALAFLGIGKALALWSWADGKKVVSLFVASSTGEAVAMGSSLYQALSQAISDFKDPSIEVVIDTTFQKIQFTIQGNLLVASDRDPNKVSQAVVLAVQQAFSFGARQLAQPVHLSDVVGVIQAIEGVVAVELKSLSTQTGQTGDLLTCGPNELLVVNPDPDGISLTTAVVG